MASAKKTTAKTSTAKKAPAKKTTATKTSATKKAPATKTTATKTSTAKKTPAKKTTTTRQTTARKRTGSVAAAAERAGGERARRRTTPLLTGPSAPESAETVATPTTTRRRRPPAQKKKAARKARPAKTSSPTLHLVPPPTETAEPAVAGSSPRARRRPPARRSTGTAVTKKPSARVSRTPGSGQAVAPGVAELLSILLSTGQLASRTLGQAAGAAAGEEWERRFSEALDFLRRRVTGDYTVDTFGFDEDFATHTLFPALRVWKDKWFRVEVRGLEHIPAEGGALLVSNHSGTIAIDSVITQLAIYDEHPQKRILRMLGADLVFELPVVGDMARKSGATLATNPDAERLMRSGELVGVWPEGFKGVGKPFRERYKLQRFGRGGFVSAAIRSEVPIIPCSVVGAEEIYPMIGNMKTVARLIGAPYAPITPFFPLLGPLGLIPLPSKWIIEFSPPVDTASLGPAAADDPMLVFDLTDQVRETIQQTLYSVLVTRRSVFY